MLLNMSMMCVWVHTHSLSGRCNTDSNKHWLATVEHCFNCRHAHGEHAAEIKILTK